MFVRLRNIGTMGVAAMLLVGCRAPEAILQDYAAQRWDALIKGVPEQAYRYYTDAFQATTSLEAFQRKMQGGLWKQAQVRQVECDAAGERCRVDVEVTVAVKMRGLNQPVEVSNTVQETWVKQGWFSDWRYVQE